MIKILWRETFLQSIDHTEQFLIQLKESVCVLTSYYKERCNFVNPDRFLIKFISGWKEVSFHPETDIVSEAT